MREAGPFPIDSMPCWTLGEDERLKALKEGKPYNHNVNPYLYFKILNRVDSNCIEGHLGRMDKSNGDTYHQDMPNHYSYFGDYLKRDPVYFTFDGISIYKLTDIFRESPLRLMLRQLNSRTYKKNHAFMIMPFHNEELNTFYTKHICEFLKTKLGITTYRDDDFRDNDIVTETAYKLIEESEFVIADTTLENKNAFYELGYAAAAEKEIITIQNRNLDQVLFFDRAHIRTLFYDTLDVGKFYFELEATIKSIRGRT